MRDLHGQTVLITGATNGIGLVTARELCSLGAEVVIVGRNIEKTKRVCDQIRNVAPEGRIDYLIADLSSLNDVRQLAAGFRKRYSKLHVLINNAGAISMERREGEEGLEYTLAVNYLAPFLLTHLLLEMLEQTGTPESPARIVNVSSDAHRGARLDFEDMQLEERYSGYGAYGRAKLAMIMFTYDLARNLREKGSPVTVNALHPGFVNSGFGRDQKGFLGVLARVILFLGRPLGKSPESGARTTIMLAASEELDGVSGKYFADEKEAESNPASLEESDWPRLRRITEELVGLRVRA